MRPTRPLRIAGFRLALGLVLGLAGPGLDAQCIPQWVPSSGAAGTVLAFATLPNGDLIVGGTFSTIGGATAASIARRSGSTWLPLGSGIQGTVMALAVLPNGDLVAGGQFTSAGGVAANHIARWDGATWSALGAGVGGAASPFVPVGIRTLLAHANGDLLAGGRFTIAGSVPANHIARWDGTAWSPLGDGVRDGGHLNPPAVVHAIAAFPNGDVAVGGSFEFAGGTFSNRVARWDGASWASMSVGAIAQGSSPVRSLLALPDGDLIAGGTIFQGFNSSGPIVLRWSSGAWTQLGPALASVSMLGDGAIHCMTALPDGDVLVGGHNVALSTSGTTNLLLRWNGSQWTPVGNGQQGDVRVLAMQPNGRVAVGGEFTSVGGTPSPGFAELSTPCPAGVTTVGTGCLGSAGLNTLVATNLPWFGGTFRAVATGMPAASLAIAITSLSSNVVPLSAVLPIGGSCSGLTSLDLTVFLVPSAGQVVSDLAIPDLPGLHGLLLHQYVAVLELDSSGTAIALTGTNRLALTLGVF